MLKSEFSEPFLMNFNRCAFAKAILILRGIGDISDVLLEEILKSMEKVE